MDQIVVILGAVRKALCLLQFGLNAGYWTKLGSRNNGYDLWGCYAPFTVLKGEEVR